MARALAVSLGAVAVEALATENARGRIDCGPGGGEVGWSRTALRRPTVRRSVNW
ncbi:protein of unknown function [Modestobacter italicus]|uniref:Uncharacterized protein n=1 Tax=Modestobacter italicus (strain DSM 44449 / CECT 9708 / BC 501) TaxID=2732864 RepID=I4EQ24_MODI5|nr:protein of unknown function [Modestobacter marinus]